MMRRIVALGLIALGIATAAPALASDTPLGKSSLIELIRFRDPMTFCGEPVPIHNTVIRERLEKEMLLTVWDRPQVILWLKRSTRYLPYIRERLSKADLPSDLQFLPIIESALRPHAGSPKGAMGFWQFTAETGRTWGLRVDDRIDERRNLRASTAAAIRYLKALYLQFGSWALAAAAYNMGEAGLAAQIQQQDQTNFYRLYLPIETQRYLLRAVTAKTLFSNPAAFGFPLAPSDYWSPNPSAPVDITVDMETPVVVLADAAEVAFSDMKRLNPEIRGYFLPPGRHRIHVPPDAASDYTKRLASVMTTWQAEHPETVYVVQSGDHLTGIAERLGVSLHSLLYWNRLRPGAYIHPGDRLVIYTPESSEAGSPPPGMEAP